MSSRQSSGGGSRASSDSRLPAIDLIGASELFSSWPMHADQPLPRLRAPARAAAGSRRPARAARAGGRPAGTCVRRISQRPVPPGKLDVLNRRRAARAQARSPSSSAVRPSSARRGRPSSRSPARLTRRSRCSVVEREDGDVDLRHDRAQQSGRLQRAEPLLAQRLGERVDLEHDVAERIVCRGAARARIEKSPSRSAASRLAMRLQRAHDAIAHDARQARSRRRRQHDA